MESLSSASAGETLGILPLLIRAHGESRCTGTRPGTVSGTVGFGITLASLECHGDTAAPPHCFDPNTDPSWVSSRHTSQRERDARVAGLDHHSSFENPPCTSSSWEIPWDILTQYPQEASLHPFQELIRIPFSMVIPSSFQFP